MIQRTTITVTGAEGGSGSASATGISSDIVRGYLFALHVAYLDTPPGTTDVVVAGAGATSDGPGVPILTISNHSTDGWYYPVAQAQDQTGADIIGQALPIAIEDQVSVSIAGANDGDGVVVTLIWDNGK